MSELNGKKVKALTTFHAFFEPYPGRYLQLCVLRQVSRDYALIEARARYGPLQGLRVISQLSLDESPLLAAHRSFVAAREESAA